MTLALPHVELLVGSTALILIVDWEVLCHLVFKSLRVDFLCYLEVRLTLTQESKTNCSFFCLREEIVFPFSEVALEEEIVFIFLLCLTH